MSGTCCLHISIGRVAKKSLPGDDSVETEGRTRKTRRLFRTQHRKHGPALEMEQDGNNCFSNESIRFRELFLWVRSLRRCTKQFAGSQKFHHQRSPTRLLCARNVSPKKIFSSCSLTLKDNWHNQIYFGPLFVIFTPRFAVVMKLHNSKKLRGSKTTKHFSRQRALLSSPSQGDFNFIFYLIKFIPVVSPSLLSIPSPFVVVGITLI